MHPDKFIKNDHVLKPLGTLEKEQVLSALDSLTAIRKQLAKKGVPANVGRIASEFLNHVEQDVLDLQAQMVRSVLTQSSATGEERNKLVWDMSLSLFPKTQPGWSVSAEEKAVAQVNQVLKNIKRVKPVPDVLANISGILEGAEFSLPKKGKSGLQAVQDLASTLSIDLPSGNDNHAFVFGKRLKYDNANHDAHLAKEQTALKKKLLLMQANAYLGR